MPLEIVAHGLSNVGRKRKQNEDSYLIDEGIGVFVVADGMGGHAAGEVASKKAVESFRDHVAKNTATLATLAEDPSPDHRLEGQTLVDRAVQAACSAIYKHAEANPNQRGMGTTFDGLVVAGNGALVAHVGDSRVYLIRRGNVHRLTEDHTFLNAQIRAGAMTPEEAAESPLKSVLTRGVGIQESVEVDTLYVEFLADDVIILCSDGLHGYLNDDEELVRVLGENTLDKFPQALIDMANLRGGKDNITALVLRVSDAEGEEPQESEASAKMDALEKLPLFYHFSYKERAAVLAVAQTKSYEQGEEIVAEGQLGQEMYVVVRGCVAVEKGGVTIAELEAGGQFGEMGLVESAPRSATVRARESTRVLSFSQNEVMNLMRKDQSLAVKLLWSFVQVLSQRLRAANSDLSEARQELWDAQKTRPFMG